MAAMKSSYTTLLYNTYRSSEMPLSYRETAVYAIDL